MNHQSESRKPFISVSPYAGGGWQIMLHDEEGKVLDHLGVFFCEAETQEIAKDEAFIRRIEVINFIPARLS